MIEYFTARSRHVPSLDRPNAGLCMTQAIAHPSTDVSGEANPHTLFSRDPCTHTYQELLFFMAILGYVYLSEAAKTWRPSFIPQLRCLNNAIPRPISW